VAISPNTIIGYDPGGNGRHGVAELHLKDGELTRAETQTMLTAEDVISLIEESPHIAALGVDTLSCWSTGPSGWRAADRWLRQRYPAVHNSVVNANGLFGSMGLNGMAVLLVARCRHPGMLITETHPKVLYYHMTARRYDYAGERASMDSTLAAAFGKAIAPANHHEWDAALSAYAALEALTGRWAHDLLGAPTEADERLIWPCEGVHYFWPEPSN
jgi:hypothetical protein